MSYRIGVDIGGTFTDFCVFNEASGELHSLKVLSTPERPGSEVMEGVRQIGSRFGVAPDEIGYFTHGTTVGINTLIQRKGIRLALFATAGFCDVLELARLKMPDPYDLFSRRPPPLVSRDRVFPIAGRIAPDGTVDEPLEEASVRAALAQAKAAGAEGIVVALLHAYRNPQHEQAVKAIVRASEPEMFVSCSSEVWPIIREYERTVTAVVSGYVQPRVAFYLSSLQAALKDAGVKAAPLITKSNGGVMSAELGKRNSVQMLLSGTASGVIGASHVARMCGLENAMSLDIGGTSADMALIMEGNPQYGTGEQVGDFPIFIPTVSVTSVGEGGGSIAWVDPLGVLKVGPESAGSSPGPACYGKGGERATITDAFAVCGFIGAGGIGYNAVRIDVEKAKAAVGAIAAKLGLDLMAAAEAIIKVAVSGTFVEVSKLVSRYGVDPRDFALIAFGGAGPMLAAFLARELGIAELVIPTAPGVLSALGGLIADVKNDFIKTAYLDVGAAMAGELKAGFAELLERAVSWLRDEQGFREDYRLLYSADMRYRGQSFEIETPLEAGWVEGAEWERIAAAFHRRHEEIYDYADAAAAVQIINLRLVILGPSPKPEFTQQALTTAPPKPEKTIEVHYDGKRRTVPLYARRGLLAGQRFAGPAVVGQDDCTTCIPDGFDVRVDAYGNLLLRYRS
ncbi:MAG TPA: hydantoinase/oxoprolinase family protein [Alphaproteobacteria bacterium]|nr:hydantoinase/oxoprolinase family protein [Alphaproteobacteria bacterium]